MPRSSAAAAGPTTPPAATNVTNATLAEALRDVVDCYNGRAAWDAKMKGVLKKWEDRGVSKRALKSAMKERTREIVDFIADQRQFLRLMAIEGAVITPELLFQDLDMTLAGQAKREHSDWVATDSGYSAGFNGAARQENPFPAGSEWYVLFDTGWLRGNEAMKQSIEPGVVLADQRRGRTPAAAPMTAPAVAPAPSPAPPPPRSVRAEEPPTQSYDPVPLDQRPPPMWDDEAGNADLEGDGAGGEVADDLGLNIPDVPPPAVEKRGRGRPRKAPALN